MRFFKYIIIFLLCLNCIDKNDSEAEKIFNQTLGIENTETLNKLVNDFENNYLKKKYPNITLSNAYKKFIEDVRDEKPINKNIKLISAKSIDLFNSSKLRLEIYQFPDSVWIIKNSNFNKHEDSLSSIRPFPVPYLESRYKHQEIDGSYSNSYSRQSINKVANINFDSIIKAEYNKADFNSTGLYMKAFSRIKNDNKYYQELYDIKNDIGFVYRGLTARKMLYHSIDLNDKLNRKIVVLELAY